MAQASRTFRSNLTEVRTYLAPCCLAHSSASRSSQATYKSLLLPTRRSCASGERALASWYHFVVTDVKDSGLVRSKTSITPLQPLKQADMIERYLSWPAVSQMQSFTGSPRIVTSLILKSIVVTAEDFSGRNSPSIYFQKRVVFPTLGSPAIIILQCSQLLEQKYRSQIIIIQPITHPL